MLKKFIIPAFLLSVLLVCCTSSKSPNSNNRVVAEICDTTTFNYDQNDTTKVVFINGVIYDTTACSISGYILDERNSKPIPNAVIYLNDNFVLHAARADQGGYFTIFNEIVCRANNWELSLYHEMYHCMKIRYTQKHGGVNIKIKLRKK